MGRKLTGAIIGFGVMTLVSFAAGSIAFGDGGKGEKGATKIIITQSHAIIDGDTGDLDDLEENIRRLGELNVTIIDDSEDWEKDAGTTRKRNELVKFGDDVVVEEDEKISGSVVVFGGSATIAGVVTEDVVVFGGDLIAEETADIRGSAVCFGGEIDKRPGAKIGDQEVGFGKFPFGVTIGPFIGLQSFGGFIDRGVSVFAGIICLGLLLLFGAGALFFFPKPLRRVSEAVDRNLVKNGVVGLLGEIMLLPLLLVISIVLCVSIIGIPLLFLIIPLCLLGVFAAAFLGYLGVAMFAGNFVSCRLSGPISSEQKTLAIGIITLLIFDILAAVVGLTGGILWPVKVALGFTGGLVGYLAMTIGFGAVIMTRFGTRGLVATSLEKPEAD